MGWIGLGIAVSLFDDQARVLGENGRTVIDVLGSIGIVALASPRRR